MRDSTIATALPLAGILLAIREIVAAVAVARQGPAFTLDAEIPAESARVYRIEF